MITKDDMEAMKDDIQYVECKVKVKCGACVGSGRSSVGLVYGMSDSCIACHGDGYHTYDIQDVEYDDKVMRMTPLEMVQEYARTAGQAKDPTLALKLIQEEYIEWEDSDTKEEELKELTDLVYVVFGYANARGWDLDESLRRVHMNNMGRMYQEDGTIQRRGDGKIIKRPGYPKVNLEDLV